MAASVKHAIAYFALVAAALISVFLAASSISTYFFHRADPDNALPTTLRPGERLLRSVTANAALPSAEPHDLYSAVADATVAKYAAELLTSITRVLSGGLWVGGRLTLTTHRLIFSPNALNRLVHRAPLSDVVLDLADVDDVSVSRGLLTDVAEVRTRGHSAPAMKFRAFGCEELSRLIKDAAAERQGDGPGRSRMRGARDLV